MTLSRDVPDEETAVDCPYCDQSFPAERFMTLHRGLEHQAECSEAELAAHEEATEAEADDLRLFQLQAVGLLVLLYFGLLITYALAT